MWFRFLIISLIKWLASLAAVYLLYEFIIRTEWPNFVQLLITWTVIFFLAFLFAGWALAKTVPNRRTTLSLLLVWLLVTVFGFLIYGILFSVHGPWILVTKEILVQLALEVVAIFSAAYRMRRFKVEAILEETTIIVKS